MAVLPVCFFASSCGLANKEQIARQQVFGSTPSGGTTPHPAENSSPVTQREAIAPAAPVPQGNLEHQVPIQEGSVWGNLESYNFQSVLLDQTPGGEIRLFSRDIGEDTAGSEVLYVVVHLQGNVHPQILTANDAVPETAEDGDIRWAGNTYNLEPLDSIAQRNAEREILTADGRVIRGRLITAFTGGYHQATGAPTETIIHQGRLYHKNDWRIIAAINYDGSVAVGTFQSGMIDPNKIYMAFGGGPLCLYPRDGVPVVAHTDYDPKMEEARRYGPWNPLSEDHGSLDTDGNGQVDRIEFYNGNWPAIGVGVYRHADGSYSLIHAYGQNITQMQLMKELQLMGCTWGFPCDGDTKAQMVYRNGPFMEYTPHSTSSGISTAIAYYIEM
jgi:hypothetical protein